MHIFETEIDAKACNVSLWQPEMHLAAIPNTMAAGHDPKHEDMVIFQLNMILWQLDIILLQLYITVRTAGHDTMTLWLYDPWYD